MAGFEAPRLGSAGCGRRRCESGSGGGGDSCCTEVGWSGPGDPCGALVDKCSHTQRGLALLARGANWGALVQVSNEQLDAALQLGVCAGQSYLVTVCACQLVKGFIDDGLGVWQPLSEDLPRPGSFAPKWLSASSVGVKSKLRAFPSRVPTTVA